jgi:hypothetical protein
MDAIPSSGLIPLLVGVALLLVFGGLVGFLVYAGWRGKQEKLALLARRARARPGRARVVQASSKQISGGQRVITDMYLTLSVETPRGPVQAQAVWTVDPLRMDQLREGCLVDVLVDADAPHRVYPAASWAEQSGMDPNRWMTR